MNLEDLLGNQLSNPETLSKIGQRVGADPSQVAQLSRLALPTMVEALTRNAGTAEGAASLARALGQHRDAKVDDLAGFFDNVDTDDGAKIVQHMFGDNRTRVQNNLAARTGLDSGQVMALLVQFAPLLLGMLGNQQGATQSGSGGGLLGSLLGGILGGGQSQEDAGTTNLGSLLAGMLGGSGGSSQLSGLAAQLLDGDDDAASGLGGILGGR